MKKRESEKHKSWGFPADSFLGHVATDGSLPGRAGKWRACGWAVVQFEAKATEWASDRVPEALEKVSKDEH